MTTRDPHIMTVSEAAEVVGKTPDTIYQWIKKEAVTKFTDPGGTVYVDVRECLPRPAPAIKAGTLPSVAEWNRAQPNPAE